jgi:hypothetical protein
VRRIITKERPGVQPGYPESYRKKTKEEKEKPGGRVGKGIEFA